MSAHAPHRRFHNVCRGRHRRLAARRGPLAAGLALAALVCLASGAAAFGDSADIAVAIVESRDPGMVGVPMTYTAVVSNAGPDDALDVLFSLPLSAAASPLSATPSQGSCAIVGRTLTCSLGDVGADETASVEFLVRPDHSGAIAVAPDVAAANVDLFPENNHACEVTLVVGAASVKGARLNVQVVDSPDPVQVGLPLTYTVTVRHDGGFAVPTAAASLELPFGMWLMSAVPSQGTCGGERLIVCDLGPMAPGQQVTVTVTALVLRGGALKGTGIVSSPLADPVVTDNVHDVVTQAEDPPA